MFFAVGIGGPPKAFRWSCLRNGRFFSQVVSVYERSVSEGAGAHVYETGISFRKWCQFTKEVFLKEPRAHVYETGIAFHKRCQFTKEVFLKELGPMFTKRAFLFASDASLRNRQVSFYLAPPEWSEAQARIARPLTE